MYFTLWEGPAPVVCRLGDSSGILPWWGGASVRYHVGGVGTRTSHCGVGIRYCTVWKGGVWDTCVLCAVNRTGHVTVFVGGVGFIHGIVHGARCVTVWDEPTHTRYVVRGGPGSCTCVQYAQFDVYYDNAIVMSARAGA